MKIASLVASIFHEFNRIGRKQIEYLRVATFVTAMLYTILLCIEVRHVFIENGEPFHILLLLSCIPIVCIFLTPFASRTIDKPVKIIAHIIVGTVCLTILLAIFTYLLRKPVYDSIFFLAFILTFVFLLIFFVFDYWLIGFWILALGYWFLVLF